MGFQFSRVMDKTEFSHHQVAVIASTKKLFLLLDLKAYLFKDYYLKKKLEFKSKSKF